jgi:hypothetical protein
MSQVFQSSQVSDYNYLLFCRPRKDTSSDCLDMDTYSTGRPAKDIPC